MRGDTFRNTTAPRTNEPTAQASTYDQRPRSGMRLSYRRSRYASTNWYIGFHRRMSISGTPPTVSGSGPPKRLGGQTIGVPQNQICSAMLVRYSMSLKYT